MKDEIIQELESLSAKPGAEGNLELYGFTKRELDVIQLIIKNKKITNEEISKKIFASTGTVKKHLVHIYEKIGSRHKGKVANRHTLSQFVNKEILQAEKMKLETTQSQDSEKPSKKI